MTPIQRLDSSTLRACEAVDEGSDASVPEHDAIQTDELPQGVTDLLLQLLPGMPLLSLKAAHLQAPAAKRMGPDEARLTRTRLEVRDANATSLRREQAALRDTADAPRAPGISASPVTHVSLATPALPVTSVASLAEGASVDSAGVASLFSDSGRTDTETQRLETGRGPETLELRMAERSRPIFSSGADTPAASRPSQAQPTEPPVAVSLGQGDGAYLKLPFSRHGVTGVVTVHRQTDEALAPLQLSTRQPDICAHLTRQLESTPQSQWAMADASGVNVQDESQGQQTSQDSRQDPDEEAPRQPPEEHAWT